MKKTKSVILSCRVDIPTCKRAAIAAGNLNPNDWLVFLINREINKKKYTGITRKRYRKNWMKKILPRLHKKLFKKR